MPAALPELPELVTFDNVNAAEPQPVGRPARSGVAAETTIPPLARAPAAATAPPADEVAC